jgi:hypothetical protein
MSFDEETPKRGGARFALTRISSRQADSFLNNFTGLFRRGEKIEEDDPELLTRPKSQDTLGDELSIDDESPEKKKKKKKDKGKGKGLWRWDSKTEVEDSDLASAKSLESLNGEDEDEDSPRRKKKRGKKGVKFEREMEGVTSMPRNSQEEVG